MNAVMVCVDYADILAITLPYNRHHFKRVLVVTSPKDTATLEVAKRSGADAYTTDAFYRDGALFNKFRALEEGLDVLGRTGWLTIMDADVLWPRELAIENASDGALWLTRNRSTQRVTVGTLLTPLRRMMVDVTELTVATLPKEQDWHKFPLHRQQQEWAGYTQIFHGSDPVLGTPPWHQLDWTHCGGGDSFFQMKWHRRDKVRPPFEVLHLGPAGTNWAGVSAESRARLDRMMAIRKRNQNFDHERIQKR